MTSEFTPIGQLLSEPVGAVDAGDRLVLRKIQEHLGSSCDDEAQAAFGWIWSSAIVVTRSPGGGRTSWAAMVLGGDRGRYGE